MRPAVFLDRDDTFIENRSVTSSTAHPGDLLDPELVRLMPGTGAAMARLVDAGFVLVAVTNQGSPADAIATLELLERVNDRVRRVLAGHDPPVRLDGIYYCPFDPRGIQPPYNRPHSWRKPGPGMILAAAEELAIDLSRSWMVGDAERDAQSAIAAGIAPERCLWIGPERPIPDLARAAELILGR